MTPEPGAGGAPQSRNVFTIPAGVPFAKALAAKLLEGTEGAPEQLAEYRIFLPTRRACAVLREAFLQLSDAPLLLPRMQPLGDIDGEELSLALTGHELQAQIATLPPAIEPLRRQVLLARLIEKQPAFDQGFDQALELAAALGRFLDQVHIENLSMDSLQHLAPDMFAGHWQKTIDFLKIISEHWPRILAEEDLIDGADRRNRLLRAQAESWRRHPPATPVIAAGSTGSMPATAELLGVIAALPQGAVILPGLDTAMEEADWNALDESHPQFGLRQLLQRMDVTREQVKPWPCEDTTASAARRALAGELMRPAATTLEWQNLSAGAAARSNFAKAFENLNIFECAGEREEAEIIAALMRETLETPGKTAALVTPDRTLARRVAMACRRWGIAVDDSAGQSLNQTPAGTFLRLILQAAGQNFAPVPLLALLKHDRAACGLPRAAYHAALETLEKALRGTSPPPGLAGLKARIADQSDSKRDDVERLLRFIEPILGRFTPVSKSDKKYKINDLINIHLDVAEALAERPDETGADRLWIHEDGEAAASFLADMQDHGPLFPEVSLADYSAILETLMAKVTVRPAWGMHPRLSILGQLESRLAGADRVILGGLNEGTWPQTAGHDPWMSRPMRRDFGLPARERDIGLSAHDFVQGFCRPDVAFTRAAKSQGAPALPARWLQRLEIVQTASGITKIKPPPLPGWVRTLDQTPARTAAGRPEPRPPLDRRPRRLPVTQIETWQKDPYGIYARYILGLKKLEPLDKPPDAAERGKLLHAILQQFVQECPNEIPPDAAKILHAIARAELDKRHENPAVWSFWWPRFAKIADWLVAHETGWRRRAKPVLTELKGRLVLEGFAAPFTLEATPDRIDETADGPAVIDYKTGGGFTLKGIKNGEFPQLALEALIARQGGFPGVKAWTAAYLSYWVLKSAAAPGELKEIAENKDGMDEILDRTEAGLHGLIAAFDDPAVPYYSLPRPDNAPRFNDYEHLARVREWAALGDAGSEAA